MLCGGIEPQGRKGRDPGSGAILDEITSLRVVIFPEEPDGLLRHAHCTPEVDLKELLRELLRRGLRLSCEDVSGIVENDVNAPERVFGPSKRGLDLVVVGDVDLRDKELG